jgi:hypothetical protein
MDEKEKTENVGTSYPSGNKSSDDLKPIENHLDSSKHRRPCAKCGKLPTKEGHDACLGTLPGVIDACCGHGVREAYIHFENGVTIRGSLVTEFVQANLKNKYK